MKKSKAWLLMVLVLAVAAFAWGSSPAYAGPGGGTYYANSPAGGASGTALRKFVDSLPGLGAGNANNLGNYIPIATPTAPPAGVPADGDYYEIGLRDYFQKMHSDLPKATRLRGYYQKTGPDTSSKYLGPLIIAQRNRPVRIKFFNELGIGSAGDLFIPVDTTAMGAGKGPKFPDGTPCDPATQACASYTQNRAAIHLHGGNTPWISDGTPRQWITPVGENTTPFLKGESQQNVPDMPDPGQGAATYYYPNQQSSRLMWYHDHAYGLTRLNAYVGEAAGYLLTDPQEDALIAAGTIPGAAMPAVYRYGIPLIIQDKTFVPQDVAVQDAKWDLTKWGQPGDLWFPHVYETNQDPNSEDGTNPFGRWDYGPWFWPPVPIAPDKATLPDPSLTPEAFMDTMLVNGAAYPFLPVQPTAYRFRILNACNDRMLNLQLYYVDPANPTEVKMVPALPNTGLPPTWPTDGRDGGVPDPTLVGPPFIQIGTEGGLLPNPVVIDSTPVGYEYNRRNIVVLNVANKSLFLGPAERADVIIDFSSVPSGSKLILYNDSPAPVPASDPRVDYYTGNLDFTSSGGAPTTLPGFGPNTRTIMQFQVTGTATAPFNLAALQTALPTAYLASQDAPIVPQVDYPATYNAATNTYAKIQDFKLTFTPLANVAPGTRPVTMPLLTKAIQELWDPYGRMNATLGVELPFTNNNIQTTIPLGYVDPISETIPDGQPQIWKITHNGVDTHPVHFHLFNVQVINRVGWDGQIRPPDPNELGWKETVRMHPLEDCIVALIGKKQTGLPFIVPNSSRVEDTTQPTDAPITVITPVDVAGTVAGNPITILNKVQNYGWEYVWHCHILGHEENDFMRVMSLLVPTAVPVAASGLTATAVGNVVQVSWMTGAPTVANPDPEIAFRIVRDGTPLTAFYAGLQESVGRIDVTNGGTGYTTATITFINEGVGTGAAATATIVGGVITGITVTNSGSGYSTPPVIVITGDGTGATATSYLRHTYTDTMVAPSTPYTYSVVSYNSLGNAIGSPTAPVTMSTWPPATGVTITPNQPSPHIEGTGVIFTASGSGSTVTYQYRFWLNDGVTNTMVQDYGLGSSWTLPASTAVGNYTITADVRTNGASATPDATASLPYQIVSAPITGVTITANKPSPYPKGTLAVMFTAAGPAAGYQYQFWMDGIMVQDFGVGASWTMPPSTAAGNHLIAVNARLSSAATTSASSNINFLVSDEYDFNNDGKSDILWRHATSGEVIFWDMNGVSISYHGSPGTVGDMNWEVKGRGDFNGDGIADILWQNKTNGQVYIWLMNGTTIIGSGSPFTVGDLNWEIKGIGDFNGDGKKDILWQNKVSGQVLIWLMNGMTIASTGSPFTVGDLNWEIKGVADFNGDGSADILWQSKASGQVVIWLMNGTAIASTGSPFTVSDLNWEIKGVGDFNKDGFADILWQSKASGQVVIWLMNEMTIASTGSPFTVGDLNWEIKGVADYNGDVAADILWRNKSNGQVQMWLMNGTTINSNTAVGTVADLNWEIK